MHEEEGGRLETLADELDTARGQAEGNLFSLPFCLLLDSLVAGPFALALQPIKSETGPKLVEVLGASKVFGPSAKCWQ